MGHFSVSESLQTQENITWVVTNWCFMTTNKCNCSAWSWLTLGTTFFVKECPPPPLILLTLFSSLILLWCVTWIWNTDSIYYEQLSDRLSTNKNLPIYKQKQLEMDNIFSVCCVFCRFIILQKVKKLTIDNTIKQKHTYLCYFTSFSMAFRYDTVFSFSKNMQCKFKSVLWNILLFCKKFTWQPSRNVAAEAKRKTKGGQWERFKG